MTDDRLVYSSLVDTYLVYGIIGLLVLIALIGLIILLTTSYCCMYCYFHPSSSYFCCYPRHRHSSYKLNKKREEQENTKKISFIKRHSSDITNFSQLYNSSPYLINNNAIITTGVDNKNLNTSCATINTLVTPIPTCRSFTESVPTVQNNLGKYSQTTMYKINTAKDVGLRQISRQFTSHDRSISPAVISLDITRVSSSESDNNIQRNSPCTNIYETVIPVTNLDWSLDPSTPIYETEWTHNLKQFMANRIPSTHYFQQKHPHDRVLANRARTSNSMRRNKMLKRLKDDAAFLY